jgi:CHASE2 domain-containing sensor protein
VRQATFDRRARTLGTLAILLPLYFAALCVAVYGAAWLQLHPGVPPLVGVVGLVCVSLVLYADRQAKKRRR